MTATIPALDDVTLDQALAAVRAVRSGDDFGRATLGVLGIDEIAPGALGYLKVANLVRCMRQGYLDGFPGDNRVCYTHIGEIAAEGAEGVKRYDYLYDFWPDLSWGGGMVDDIRAILTHHRFPEIDAWLRAKYGWDLAATLVAGALDPEGEGDDECDELQRQAGETTEEFCRRVWAAGYRPL